MARPKRNSAVLETARQRIAALKTITPTPNFSPSLDLDQYEQDMNALAALLRTYNDTLTLLDRLRNELGDAEALLREMSKRVLAAVGAFYGLDSNEYEAAGGTRTSERKRPTTRKKRKTTDS
jgi:hypothetical protein